VSTGADLGALRKLLAYAAAVISCMRGDVTRGDFSTAGT